MSRRYQKTAEKKLQLRKMLWPEIKEEDLWNRHGSAGFVTIPRLLPLMMDIMDGMSKNKPLSMAYMELFCRSYDEAIVSLTDDMAFYSGFDGQRGIRTWKERLKILESLGFISLRGGRSGGIAQALIFNPYRVIKKHYEEKHPAVSEEKYTALMVRAIDIGASDLSDQTEVDNESAPEKVTVSLNSSIPSPPRNRRIPRALPKDKKTKTSG